MAGRVVDLLSSPHLAAEALLPWLLNGTLAPAERGELEAHLQACPQCAADLGRQRELMALYASSPAPEPACDSEAALARLQARLRDDAELLPAPSSAAKHAPGHATARPAARPAIQATSPWRWWPLALALQLGIILAFGATLWLQFNAAPNDAGAAYRGLAAPTQRDAGDAIVIFDPATSEAGLRTALQRAGARVVDGPTAQGAYVVRFDAVAVQTEVAVQTAIAVLRADRAVIRVESLAPVNR